MPDPGALNRSKGLGPSWKPRIINKYFGTHPPTVCQKQQLLHVASSNLSLHVRQILDLGLRPYYDIPAREGGGGCSHCDCLIGICHDWAS